MLALSPASASALFWCVRNAILLERGLADRDDVAVVSYDRLVADPAPAMTDICRFLGFEYDDRLIEGIEQRSAGTRDPLPIDPRIRARCDEIGERLDAIAVGATARGGPSTAEG